ncbi:hypothetical protein Caci_2984 [Catenulispora acidiphila DSM 44928]|uniref:Uncharacterized protein n=1 Tax=Catenulispora acidiphila (strain DSM 44928 / JCM 14897 / NBRC 102108 / NRRL B-24433 / ID139908) TaxID=479433 RepID=C7Q301_CATAD|nr:DUF6205 family protein [Catenulispora acidiphila]ACU71893.1 hypothetical protein Caci_2984 [Catenulispora acidiphila DSM 44928]
MSYDNRFSGAITITPPLTWSEIEAGPALRDLKLEIRERRTVSDDGDTETVRRTADRILPRVRTFSGTHVLEDLQAIVAHYEGHEFGGFIQMQPDPGFDDPIPTRYMVHGREVVEVRAVLVWPGEGDEEELLEILADAGDGGTYVVKCAGDFDRPQGVPVEDTDLPEQLLAWRDAAVKAATDETLREARALARECKDVLDAMPVGLDELLGIDFEDLPDWFTDPSGDGA